jgi:CHAD domain-containing protein
MPTKNAGLQHVLTALGAQLRAIHAHARGARVGRDPEDLHEMRVAVRRLRAILRAGRALFERKWTEDLRGELRWLGRALGRVRDLDVLLASLRARLEAALRHPRVVAADLSLLDVAAEAFEKLRTAVKDLPKRPTDEDLHTIRIALKRAHYAAELVRDTTGRRGERFLEQAKALQDVRSAFRDEWRELKRRGRRAWA